MISDPKERWPHLKLTARYKDDADPYEKGTVSIDGGCNCVLLTTATKSKAGTHYGSYGSIDRCGAIYTDYVDRGDLTDLRSFLPFWNFPKGCPPGTPPIPDAWERWLDACEAAIAAFEKAGPPR